MIYRDLKVLCGVELIDVIEGRGPNPSLVLWLILGLPDTSMLSAMRMGGLHYLGHGEDRELATQLFNALQLNTQATGNWSKRPPELPTWPKPKPYEPPRKKSLADIAAAINGPGAYPG